MSPAKKPARATSSARATKKKTAKKPVAKKSTPKKTTAKKTAARSTAKSTKTTKKTSASSRTAGKATKKSATSGAKKTVAKAPVKKTTARAAAPGAPEAAPTRKRPEKKILLRRAPKKTTPTKKPRPAKLDKPTLDKIKAQLTTERKDLSAQLEQIDAISGQGTQSEITGEVGLDEDFADAGSATFDRERDFSIRNNIRDLIDQIDRALTRIGEGSYGSCERCGQPIDAARLKALPHASLCLDCKRREERVR
jgi:RNA polymerase-binding protein DksA